MTTEITITDVTNTIKERGLSILNIEATLAPGSETALWGHCLDSLMADLSDDNLDWWERAYDTWQVAHSPSYTEAARSEAVQATIEQILMGDIGAAEEAARARNSIIFDHGEGQNTGEMEFDGMTYEEALAQYEADTGDRVVKHTRRGVITQHMLDAAAERSAE